MIALAAEHVEAAQSLVKRVNDAILFPLITLGLSVAVLFFLWGAFQYVYHSDNESGRETGKRHLFYGIIGLLVMISAFAILSIAAGTFGITPKR